MISAIASTTFICLSYWERGAPPPSRLPCERAGACAPAVAVDRVGLRSDPQPHGLPSELFGHEVPAQCGVVRGCVRVAMTALDRLRVEDGARAAALEQAVDGAHAEPRDECLVAAVADAIEPRETPAPRRPGGGLAAVLPMGPGGRAPSRG